MFIKVKVFSQSKKEKITKRKEDCFDVAVKEKPENNAANKRVKEILAEYFCKPVGKIRLIKGAQQKSKIFSIL